MDTISRAHVIKDVKKLVTRLRDAYEWKPVKGSPETHIAMLQSECRAVANKLERSVRDLEETP